MKQQPTFTSHIERDKWILDNADYFTTVYRKDRQYNRQEHKTLPEAEAAAKETVMQVDNICVLVYAVCGNSDAYVKTVTRDHANAERQDRSLQRRGS